MRRALVMGLVVLVPLHAAWAGCAPIAVVTPTIWCAAVADDSVQITFLGHASFEIVSPAGVRAVTDYNGVNIPLDPPDIATMNHAHATHYTPNPTLESVTSYMAGQKMAACRWST